ncbi:MAG TPA: hypothetical protein VK627_06040 [Edaphobacter sp.]|nr:hypothetical protein [Edaphobacter sp.]
MRRLFFAGLVMWFVVSVKVEGQMKPQGERGPGPPYAEQFVGGPRGGDVFAVLRQGRNIERQGRLVSDTNKLVALTSSLKQQAEKGEAVMPAAEVIKRAEEIEKLAKSVKERMKG